MRSNCCDSLSVAIYSGTTSYDAAYKRYQRVQSYLRVKYKMARKQAIKLICIFKLDLISLLCVSVAQ
jgi:hypothetical protein